MQNTETKHHPALLLECPVCHVANLVVEYDPEQREIVGNLDRACECAVSDLVDADGYARVVRAIARSRHPQGAT